MKRIVVLLSFLFSAFLFSQQGTATDVKSSSEQIKVFPNPATNVINVLGLHNSKKATIVISDSYGNPLMNYQWEIRNNALNIPIANLEPGIYLLYIHSPEQKIQKKFVKQ
ncbi:T9SS type A sorting domain-containing protein [Maribacter litopenaei]|uniref:T9SS type A sorting domain-containing protein n=1 Tax=Maribacter litopenaei TaxID=2976127 RepID=A0ABY5YBI3_9FLAO|nr:T9SS type A sorting domain-containing protein [Maribacter litopenaei]UWX55475.1 T9SS type A sorting domain-containing protein [Maribacter litopenaei]